jgi:hypothetical protein
VIRGIKYLQISNSVLHPAERQADAYVFALTETLRQSPVKKAVKFIHKKTSNNVTKKPPT